jgi:hypothetical protein
MLPQTLLEVLNHEAPIAIATQGEDGPHLSNTWNSYVQVSGEDTLIVPAGGLRRTEANIAKDDRIKMSIASRQVKGKNGGQGTGFVLTGTAKFHFEGPSFEKVKERYSWARAAVVVKVETAEQTL